MVLPLDGPGRVAWRSLAMAAVETAGSPLHAHHIRMQFLFQRGSGRRGRGAGEGQGDYGLTTLGTAPFKYTVDRQPQVTMQKRL
jgi:hypothetical protein